jgi:hypothetical protein
MPDTFTLIASSTVGAGGAASIDFTSIPSTYTDLCLMFSGRTTSNAGQNWSVTRATFNGSSANWNYRGLYGDGASASSGNSASLSEFGFGSSSLTTANTFGSTSIYIPNYAGSAAKSVSVDSVTEHNGTTALMGMIANLWNVTSAITSISLPMNAAYGVWAQHTTAYLYGVSNA